MASLVEIRAAHMSLAGLPEPWQVTRAAPGWSPGDTVLYLRLCLGTRGHLRDCCTATHTVINTYAANPTSPLTYWFDQKHLFSLTLMYSNKKKKRLNPCHGHNLLSFMACTHKATNLHKVKRCDCYLTWIRASTLSWTIVGGLFLGEMILTSTPSTKSLLVTKAWKRWPQFFTHVSRTWRTQRVKSFTTRTLNSKFSDNANFVIQSSGPEWFPLYHITLLLPPLYFTCDLFVWLWH